MFKGLALHHLTAGFIAVLVGFTSSFAIVYQAAQALGATAEQITSWLLALGVGMAVTSGVFSLWYRIPVLTAWSTPGAALLVTSLVGVSMGDAIGAFVFTGLLIVIFGLTGWFERISHFIPMPIASAMLAGVLFRFGADVSVSMQSEFALVLLMFAVYLLARRFLSRYAMLLVLLAGLAYAAARGQIQFHTVEFSLAMPVFVMPTFDWLTMLSIGVPLFIVTMTSQNLPGIAVLKAHDYHPPLSPIITGTGIATMVLSPFGGFSFNFAAITAAICMGREADDDPKKRYLASFAASIFYLLLGLFGAGVVLFFVAIPEELVLAVAGLALIGTIGNGLHAALVDEGEREAALITFLVTASGMVLWGIGAAFWGLVAGVLARWVLRGWRNVG